MFDMRGRRAFIAALAIAPIWSLAARAEQPKLLRLGSLKLTEPNGKSVHINVAQVTFIRSDTHISGANAELGLTSGKVQGCRRTSKRSCGWSWHHTVVKCLGSN
jgi:hypothetical protein